MKLIGAALSGIGAIWALAVGYFVVALMGRATFTWGIFAGWLALLVAGNLVLLWALARSWARLTLRLQVLGMLWLSISLWYWVVAPIFFFLVMNVDRRQSLWAAFAFIWEVPVIGGGLFLTTSLALLAPIATFMAGKQQVARPERLYRSTLRYPVVISVLVLVLSTFGYVVGTAQLRIFAGLPGVEQGKNLATGLAIAVFLAVLIFLVLDTYLNKVRERLKHDYTIARTFWRSLQRRVVAVTAAGLLGSVGLFGLLLFDTLQALLGEEANRFFMGLIVNKELWGPFLGGIGLVLGLATGVMVFVGRLLTRALRALAASTRQAEREEMVVPALYTGDEIEVLSWALKEKISALALQRNRFREAQVETDAIFEGMGEGLVVTDRQGQVARVNRQAAALIGWEVAELTGKSWGEVVHMANDKGERVPSEARPIQRVLHTRQPAYKDIYTYKRRDGTVFPVSMKVSALIHEDEVVGAILLFRDITREKAIDQAKTEFVSLASHQLRTPLTAISWYIELLLRGDPLTDSQRSDLTKIRLRSQRLIRLVNDLLNVSRLDTGRLKIDPTPTDLVGLLTSVVDELLPFAEQRACHVIFHKTDDQFDTVPVDRSLLRQVVHNLLANAIKYSPPGVGSRVWVQLERSPQGAYLMSVQDSGIGIPREIHGRIFEKFFRAPNAVSKETDGSGLGLYVAKKIFQAAGGKIWFESVEGQNTTFFVEIPADGMREKAGLDLVL